MNKSSVNHEKLKDLNSLKSYQITIEKCVNFYEMTQKKKQKNKEKLTKNLTL